MSKAFSLLFIFFSSTVISQEEPQLPMMNVFGQVKSICIESQWMNDDQKLKLGVINQNERLYGNKSLQYDPNGYWKQYMEYNDLDQLIYGRLYTYDSLGYLNYEAYLNNEGQLHSEIKRTRNTKYLVIKEEHMNPDTEDVTYYEYNTRDSIIKKYVFNESNKIEEEHFIEYKKNYRFVEHIEKNRHGVMVASKTIRRDKQGRNTEVASRYPSWDQSQGTLTKFDEKFKFKKGGKEVEHFTRFGDSKFFLQDKWVYDNKGRLIESTYFIESNGFCGTFTTTVEKYEYDQFDRMTYRSSQDAYTGHFTEYNYDSAGNFILKVSGSLSSEGEYFDSTFYAYDTFGNLVSETFKDESGIVEGRSFECTYLYDQRNNWIRRDEYREGKLYYTSFRSFEYYQ